MKLHRKTAKNWEVSIISIGNSAYKVTRRLPGLSVSETKIYGSLEEAVKKFREWLN